MIAYAIISIIISISCLFMGNFIYYRNPNNQLNQVLALFSCFIAYMAFTDFGSTYVTTPEQAYWWIKTAFPWMLIGSFFIHMALLATEKFQILEKRKTYLIIYLPSIIFAILNLTTHEITQGVQMGYWGWTYLPADTMIYPIVMIWTMGLVFLSAFLVLNFYLKSSGIKRQQAKYIFIGVYFPLILGLLTEFILPALSIPAPSILNFLFALGLAFIVYGIWKFRLPQLTSSIISDNILSTMSNFLFLMDGDGKIIHVNFKAIELSGYDEKELLGHSFEAVFPQIKYHDVYSQILENVETNLTTKENKKIPVLASTSLIRTSKQEVLGLVMVGSDISQLKEAEEERDRYREHLEELVEKRTIKLEEINNKLKKEIIAHEKAENELKNSLDEKELLVKEIHHRVKNNLMILSSLLNIQSRYITDDKARKIFKESQNRANSMALIHERLYRTDSLRKIDFGEYLRTLATELFYTYQLGPEIKLNMNLDPLKLDVNSAIPLGLIVNELITNSLKYAFPEGKGELSVKFHSLQGDKFELIVEDNGIGLPEDMDFKKVDSLGLNLVNNLTGQLDADIELDKSNGTKFTIIFKESKYTK